MMAQTHSAIKKLIQFQGSWWAIVLGHVYDWTYEGVAIAALFYIWALLEDSLWKREIIFSCGLAGFGWVIDTCLLQLKLFSLPMSSVESVAPLWLVAIWWTFSMGLEDFYLMLRRFPKMLFAIGFILGPLSYYACEEFGIVHYQRPLWVSLALHGFLWTFIFPLIVWVKYRFKVQANQLRANALLNKNR